MCVLKAISVVCINPSDAHDYLAKSYRPYQDRNNKLAATYDGARGQAAQVQLGLAAVQNGTASSPTALADAGNKSEQAQGTVQDVVGAPSMNEIMKTCLTETFDKLVVPLFDRLTEKHEKDRKEDQEKYEKDRKENQAKLN